MINIADQLHAATEQGVVSSTKEIFDNQLGKDQETLNQEFASVVVPPVEKEVVSVLTAGSSAPASPEENDYYINTTGNKLYQYDGSDWVEQTPSADVLYLTADIGDIYVYNATSHQFENVTGLEEDGIIYINSLNDLNSYTDNGFYTVAKSEGTRLVYYTMTVEVLDDNGKVRQTLSNKDGYQTRTKASSSASWEYWETKTYATKDDLVYLAQVLQTIVHEDAGEAEYITIKPNRAVYQFPQRENNLGITLGHSGYSTLEQYHFVIEIVEPITIGLPTIQWVGGDPTFEDGKTYEVDIMKSYDPSDDSVINIIGLCVEVEPLTPASQS